MPQNQPKINPATGYVHHEELERPAFDANKSVYEGGLLIPDPENQEVNEVSEDSD